MSVSGGGPYESAMCQCLLRVLEALGEEPIAGLTSAALAERLREPRDRVYRALRNAEQAGWVTQGGASAWRLTSKITRSSEQVRAKIAALAADSLGLTP